MTKGFVIAPTVEQIDQDCISRYAEQYWAPYSNHKLPFDDCIVEHIYLQELKGTGFSSRRLMLLEFSQYLEKFLWPNYVPVIIKRSDDLKYLINENAIQSLASNYHTISIAAMVNEKFRERVELWETFSHPEGLFADFFNATLRLALNETDLNLKERIILITFLGHCTTSLEVDFVRLQVQKIMGLSMWSNILQKRRELEFRKAPKLKKFWKLILRNDAKLNAAELSKAQQERSFISNLFGQFFQILESICFDGFIDKEKIDYCEQIVDFLTDAIAQLPTRRFLNTVIDDCHLVVRCKKSALYHRTPEGNLFVRLLDRLCLFIDAEIDDYTGEIVQSITHHYEKICALQRTVFRLYRQSEIKDDQLLIFAASNVASIDTREALEKSLGFLDVNSLTYILNNLALLHDDHENNNFTREFLLELLLSRHERRTAPLDVVNSLPLYPTESTLWNKNIVPEEIGEWRLALPKLNLQFLTLLDYLQRNFTLFQLESTYEIRQDIEDAVSRLRPVCSENGDCLFGGWSRMALPIQSFTVVEVCQPNVGELNPSQVRADIEILLDIRRDIRNEWEALRKHDVCFLLTIRPPASTANATTFQEKFGVVYVRGCEIEGMFNAEGNLIEEGLEPKVPPPEGNKRTFRVWLDPNQYYQDMTAHFDNKEENVYSTFNVIMRRKPKENNFKAVLDTIRTLMNTKFVVPSWLHDLLLGYGDPAAAHYKNFLYDDDVYTQDWNDTFVSAEHLISCFPQYKVEFTVTEEEKQVPPFRLTFYEKLDCKKIIAEPYTVPNRGPYPYCAPKRNTVPFTSTQVEAIRAGMLPGLTIVVGPPGTGKTDVAVQIIANIYRNHPEQRTLIVTHSNQALNQIFEKIIALDVDERHLLRLGHGEKSLETERDFSRYGRVDFVLTRRLELLKDVEKLQHSLGVIGDASYTCETAGHFYLYHVLSRWEDFLDKIRNSDDPAAVSKFFPFHAFFSDTPQPLFTNSENDLEVAKGCFRHIRYIFEQLDEFLAFEQLRSGADRAKYLLVKEAKIVAMTCTHAALKRHDLVEYGFKYDNVLMEEAAQVLEIETFIPLLLQNPDISHLRLQRWIMIGDHHQLPPVVKNTAFQKYSNMEQSLFTRFIRLGVPAVQLDAQGRSRPSLAALYNWRYKLLGNLPHVDTFEKSANAGFSFDYQIVDVEDFEGVGESEPVPYFYQNLCEAEYAVALFMYMRIIGYPAEKISILTTYNGQKHLIRDVIAKRCADNPLIGRPHKVTTVDKYQGQQNDYIILSLVRTRAVGHLRDVRRLIVAMSRARLGLYIFARVSLFQNCYELTPVFTQLLSRPTKLFLAPNEVYPAVRELNERPYGEIFTPANMPHMVKFVYNLYQQKIEIWKQKLQFQNIYRQEYNPEDNVEYDPSHPEMRIPEYIPHTNGLDSADREKMNHYDEMEFELTSNSNDVERSSYTHSPTKAVADGDLSSSEIVITKDHENLDTIKNLLAVLIDKI